MSGSTEPTALRTGALDAQHRSLGARFAPFGGWSMPLQYASVIDEHHACRNDAAVFDVSHLGTVLVRGASAFEHLQRALTNDLSRIEPGRAQYTHLVDAEDGHVVDDIIVWWIDAELFSVMPNASNTDRVLAALSGADAEDVTSTRAVLAVQGPNAQQRIATVAPDAAKVARFRVARIEMLGVECLVAGTGYTGEAGIEIHVPNDSAPALFESILESGIVPAGLGARDTLRLEAGLPLHGHELGPGITPFQANLGWVVRFDKGDFIGRDALVAESERGVDRRLVGIALDGRQPAREGAIISRDGAPVGTITSGNYSPTLGHAIALGFVEPSTDIGDAVTVEVRGKHLAGSVVVLPFVGRR